MTGNIAIYQTADNRIEVEIDNKNETIWLNAENIAALFGKDRSNIQRHIKNIYAENEQEQKATCAFFAQVKKEGERIVTRQIPYYNLDIILAVGYRVSSKIATEFRRWATGVLRQYLVDGYALNEKRIISCSYCECKRNLECYCERRYTLERHCKCRHTPERHCEPDRARQSKTVDF